MTMALEYRPQPPVGGMGYDQNRYSQPQFSNPWHATAPAGPSSNQLYQPSYQHSPTAMEPPSVSKAPVYVANPAASSLGSDLVPSRSYASAYSSSATSNPNYTATAGPRYSPEHVPTSHPYNYTQDIGRRDSYPASTSSHASYSDEMAGARGIVAMANSQDLTPRNIYGANGARSGSHDSYGFPPTTHSQHSSISSATGSGYPYYGGSYNGSVDGSSVTDYSSASEDTRPLPPPTQLINGFPPEPQAMMNQFNAKMSQSAQKKHKCKICDKRFTRPSSLQTHMYSHTGEKPYACEHPGCGRHFSVVSNLRRHRKVHKEDGAGSNDDDS